MELLPARGETDRLIIRDAVFDECEKLQTLNEASDYLEKWVGWKTPDDYALRTFAEGNLPPGGKKEFFRLKTICLKDTSEIVGTIELYHGYPTEDSLCIGWMFIHPAHQKHGYALEAFKYLAGEASKSNFNKIRLGVHLKNWPALRFWYKSGFDRIAGIIGDAEHSEVSNATMILEYTIKQ